MRFFEYPYVIITVLVICFVIVGLIGVYFTIKSVKTAKGTHEKDFSSSDKIEDEFEMAGEKRNHRTLVYASVALDSAARLYSESKAMRILAGIKEVMLAHFCLDINGNITAYTKNSFVAINYLGKEETESCIEGCHEEISTILTENEAIGIARVSFGYYSTSSNEVSFRTALERAKQACTMAEDKEILCCEWDSLSGKEFEKKIKMENTIKNEIENNRFFLEYQPILDASTGRLVGAEVLSRLNSVEDGIITPGAFLTAVNNLGLNKDFDYYIFEKNCKWISNDKEKRSEYVYTINFSRSTLCDAGFAQSIIEIVEKYGLSFSCIAVEILEDKDLGSEEKSIMIQNLTALKKKGMLILLDDFGKGYTSFVDLTEFDISIVKIDKAITQKSDTESGYLILTNIIKTAHDLGFKTLCEGIETEQQKELATKAGADMLQGYYLHRPMPVTRLETLFKEN